MIKQFVDNWITLRDYCSDPTFDSKVFKIRHDNLAKAWAKLPFDIQGEICHYISGGLVI